MKPFHIKRYIELRRKELQLTTGELGRRLGRPSKSLRRLDQFTQTLQERPEFIKKIRSAIEADDTLWEYNYAQDAELIHLEKQTEEEKEREKFKPHLWMIGERRIPSPIFAVAFMGESTFKNANLPPFILLFDLKTQINIVKKRFQLFCEERNRSTGPFGAIIGYHYRQTYDIAFEFDMEGNLLSTLKGKFPTNKASLTIKGKDLGILFGKEG
jgi:hypothetical protein